MILCYAISGVSLAIGGDLQSRCLEDVEGYHEQMNLPGIRMLIECVIVGDRAHLLRYRCSSFGERPQTRHVYSL